MKFGSLLPRVIVALLGIPVIIALIYFGRWGMLLFTLFITVRVVYEFFKMAAEIDIYVYFYPLMLTAILLPVSLFFEYTVLDLAMILMFIILYLLIIMLRKQDGNPVTNLAWSLLLLIYGTIFPVFLLVIREYTHHWFHWDYHQSFYIILSWFIMIWICDTFAYFGGSALGKHKLAPEISPNKSVEGFVFGLAGAVVASFVLYLIGWLPFFWIYAVALGIILGIFGQIGDLVESRIKRITGVKDTASLLPGHGGIMDRFDSIIFTAPMVAGYLYLISRI
ncbi:MAG: phosphatidate cytidylyltransferase [Calditrichia bacterium]